MAHRTWVSVLLFLALIASGGLALAQVSDLADDRDLSRPSRISFLPIDDEGDDEGHDGCGAPDPPCYDPENRFADCGNGTVTDQVSGLVWLEDASCLGAWYYVEANEVATTLGDGTHPACLLEDNSCPGDWRLPTKDEWAAVVAQAVDNGCAFPSDIVFPDTQGLGCWGPGDLILDIRPFGYWTSTTDAANPAKAWWVAPGLGSIEPQIKVFVDEPYADPFPPLWVWPVRRGQP